MIKPTLRIRIRRFWNVLDTRIKIGMLVILIIIILAACIAGAVSIGMRLLPEPGEYTPTPTATEEQPTTAPPTLPPSSPTPQPTNTPEPVETPMPVPTPIPQGDAQGDVGTYANGEPVEGPPPGMDIQRASVMPNRSVILQPTQGIPSELADWVAEGEILLWITLHDPIPDPPEVYMEWLFALDLDGDIETGRPVDSARINPDLGMEAAIGVYYDPASGAYGSYFLVWDPGQGGLVRKTAPRYTLNESRTMIGIALSIDDLTQAVSETSGVTIMPEAVKGRAAVLARVEGQRIIDFYPDRPE